MPCLPCEVVSLLRVPFLREGDVFTLSVPSLWVPARVSGYRAHGNDGGLRNRDLYT